MENDYLVHHGILGQKWGVRRYQNPDGTLTPEGVKRYTKRNKVKSFATKAVSGAAYVASFPVTLKGASALAFSSNPTTATIGALAAIGGLTVGIIGRQTFKKQRELDKMEAVGRRELMRQGIIPYK